LPQLNIAKDLPGIQLPAIGFDGQLPRDRNREQQFMERIVENIAQGQGQNLGRCNPPQERVRIE
jgi:hypothetical protein